MDAAFMSLEGVLQTFGSVLPGRDRVPGHRTGLRLVLLILAMQ
jgi:hypothetical protein